MTDILDLIDGAVENRCACGCGTTLNADGSSAWFASPECQQRYHAQVWLSPDAAEVYAGYDSASWSADNLADTATAWAEEHLQMNLAPWQEEWLGRLYRRDGNSHVWSFSNAADPGYSITDRPLRRLHLNEWAQASPHDHMIVDEVRHWPAPMLEGDPIRLSIGGVDLSGFVRSVETPLMRARAEQLPGLYDFSLTITFDNQISDPFSRLRDGLDGLRKSMHLVLQVQRLRRKYLHVSYRHRVLARRRRNR